MIFCDTSFLFSLYGNDTHSRQAMDWVVKCTSPVTLSTLTHYEFGNALRFAEFRRLMKPAARAKYWALFEAALSQGRLISAPCNLADVVDEARRLSAIHTARGGHRGFDILHVAAALKLGAAEFLTFDENQRRLAESEGLRVPLVNAESGGAS